jgi:hypothetical protein
VKKIPVTKEKIFLHSALPYSAKKEYVELLNVITETENEMATTDKTLGFPVEQQKNDSFLKKSYCSNKFNTVCSPFLESDNSYWNPNAPIGIDNFFPNYL